MSVAPVCGFEGGSGCVVYTIEYVGMFDRDGQRLQVPDGYHADDYLPGFAEQHFHTTDGARAWIRLNHRGPQVDGTIARFKVAGA